MESDNDDTKLLISCVGENDELYTAEVLLLFKTIKKFGGNLAADAKLVANFVKSIDPTIKQNLEDLGVKVRIVEPAEHSKETTSNKIRMLEMDDDDYDYDVLIALDCDTAVVRDFSSEINSQFFQAMPADMDLLTVPQWQKLFSYFDLQIPPERFNTTKKTIITYFSSAVMSIPKQYIKRLRNRWDEYFFGLFEYCKSFEELAYHRYFFEELALSLALEKEKIPSKDFPVEMNFPTNYLVQPSFLPDNMSPFIVHYHHLYNLDGSLIKTGYKIPDLAIEQVNELLLNSDTNYITKKSESKQIPISKDVKVLQKVSLGKQKLIEERERWIKTRDYFLNKAIKDVEILHNINLGHQKTIKDVEILHNINLGHQKTIEEKDNKIMQLNESIKSFVDLKREYEVVQNINSELKKTIEEKDAKLNQFQQIIGKKETQNVQLEMEVRRLRHDIDAIHNSISWRMITPIKQRYDRIFTRPHKKKLMLTMSPSSSQSIQSQEQSTSFQTETNVLDMATATRESEQLKISPKLKEKKDIICFPIIDWSFRYQRTQHLLSKFAKSGHRIFYLTVNIYPQEKPYTLINMTGNIFEVNLNCSRDFNIYKNILDDTINVSLLSAINQMRKDLDMDALSFVVFPTWAKLVFALKEKYGWPIIYDCLDEHYDFGNINKERIGEETKLFQKSDLVITTSSYLYKKARVINGKTLYIPNAGEFDHFKNPPGNNLLSHIRKPLVGYYGAIAEWFDNEIIEYAANRRLDVNFVFIGHTFGSNISKLQKLINVHFLGEKPYQELPLYLYHFDVCLIPFKMMSLIEATHPVKLYEYFAAGKPVVSTKITELVPLGNLCYLSSNKEEFLTNLDKALNENDPDLVKRRVEFASKNTWQHRFDFLYSELNKILIK